MARACGHFPEVTSRRPALAATIALGVVSGSALAALWASHVGAGGRASAGPRPPIACNPRKVCPAVAAAVAPPAAARANPAPLDDDETTRDFQLAQGHTVDELLTAAAAGQAGDRLPARLEAMLRAEPDAVASAVAFVHSGRAERPVIEALGAAGTAPAQAGLCGLAADRWLPPRVREEAIGALVLIKRPTAPTLSAVARLLDERAATVRHTARAVAGTVARFGRQEHVAESTALERALLAEYARSERSDDRVSALAALANLGSPAVLARAKSALADGDRAVRAAAARALRLVPDPAADRLLLGLLRSDRDPTVRAAAIFAAGFRELGPLIDGLAETAETDPVESVRADSVTLLARYANLSPRVTRALAYAADNDPKSNLRQRARDALDSRR
jgi:HEAT repeat protein